MRKEKGWFDIPGVQAGDRSVAMQLMGLHPALGQARGRTVLDLGCAEGAIALEFARAGATRILGLEVIAEHLEIARQLCQGQPCEFQCADLNRVEIQEQFDIVLLLAVVHKLRDPAGALRRFASLARELVLVRMPGFAHTPTAFRHERGQRAGELVDVAKILLAGSFALERVERGPDAGRGREPVLYFRRLRNGAAV